MRNELGVRGETICLGVAVVLCSGLCCRGAGAAGGRPGPAGSVAIVSETPVAKLDDLGGLGALQQADLIQAPDLARIGYVTHRGAKSVAVINGVTSQPYDQIVGPFFSPTGGRTCLVVRQGGDWCAVVDGKEGKWYPANVLTDVRAPTFSPDGKRLAYVVHPQVSGGPMLAVVDGVESPVYDGINALGFSPDGSRVAYNARAQGGYLVVVDGKPGKLYYRVNPYDGAFSADGKHIAYVASQREGKWMVVADGVEGAEYDGVGCVTYSPDGRHLAYEACRRGKWCVVVDGKETGEYARLWGKRPAFSPDGRHLAFVAEIADQRDAVVIDGASRKELNAVHELVWSTDSARLLCKFLSSAWWVLEEGKPDREYRVLEGLALSPDLKRSVHYEQRRNGAVMVTEEGELPLFQAIGPYPAVFSPDGTHVAYVAKRGSETAGFQWHVVVDGAVSPGYDDVLPRAGRVIFHGDNRLRTLMIRGGQILLVGAQLAR